MLIKTMNLQCYGYLYGKIKLIKDNHHDEIFTEKHNIVIIRNGITLYDSSELRAIANEILGE